MTEKCAECGVELPENSESVYCAKCDAILDKKFEKIEMNLIVYKEISNDEIEVLKKFDKEDIVSLYLKLYDSYREDGDFNEYEASLLNKIQSVFALTEKEIGSDKIVHFDGTKATKKRKPLECIKCGKPVLQDDFVFCPYCGFRLD
ncbi:MAG: zinc-ribbon domain-containing protein [Actinomycetota bacterium]|jgi:DNA-directed RNA polymerase subunit RPC12/RpoP|nr:zinc-ribbon domain-containing protein [Actinomycetota bacterium]